MKRSFLACAVASVLCFPIVLADSAAERVREAALVTYYHGINQEIADRELGPESVPYLLDLLRDPDFKRRDNVVAFLVYLARDSEAPALMDLLDHPPTDVGTPEEYRARLMVPEALGRIAARGGTVAAGLLGRLERDPDIQQQKGLAQQVEHGLRLMTQTEDVSVPWYPDSDEDPPADPLAIDPSSTSHLIGITFANHVDVNNPMSRDRLDEALASITTVLNQENAGNDTACCIRLERSGGASPFGSHGDGLDVITTSAELNAVINNSIARVKVVDYIGYCGGPGSGIIGCGQTPGDGMVVVRMSTAADEGKLWGHELGHNTGLPHNSTPYFLMYASFSSSATRLSSYECNRYHYPLGQAGIPPSPFGDCHDDDDDGLVSTSDNCPDTFNPNQGNSDEDPQGDACDNCPDTDNPDQLDCDNDNEGDVCDPTLIPPPIEGVVFESDSMLSWQPVLERKHVYRGIVVPEAGFTENHVLVGTVSTNASSWTDTSEPIDEGSSSYYYYLVTTFNGCGESE